MTIDDLVAQHVALVAYLKSKVLAADWHATADAAMDLREVEAALAILRDLEKQPPMTGGHQHEFVYASGAISEARCWCGAQEATSTKWDSRLW